MTVSHPLHSLNTSHTLHQHCIELMALILILPGSYQDNKNCWQRISLLFNLPNDCHTYPLAHTVPASIQGHPLAVIGLHPLLPVPQCRPPHCHFLLQCLRLQSSPQLLLRASKRLEKCSLFSRLSMLIGVRSLSFVATEVPVNTGHLERGPWEHSHVTQSSTAELTKIKQCA